jgi:hypothetical protein
MRCTALVGAAFLIVTLGPAAAGERRDGAVQAAKASADLSAQNRRRTRVTVRPLRERGDNPRFSSDRRECRAVFTQRNIPEWGGRVLYAGQECRWVR